MAGGGGIDFSNKKCQAGKCFTKLNSINYFKCQSCLKEVCMQHRFEDKHDCSKLLSKREFKAQQQVNPKTAKSKLLMPGFFRKEKEEIAN